MEEIVVLVTAGSETEATNIARALVEQGLVACVNVLPGVRSIFQWEGKVTAPGHGRSIRSHAPRRSGAAAPQ